MIMILDCFSQKRICSEKYWFKELIILLFHSFFFPFSSEPLWKLLQSDHLQPALLPFFLLSLSPQFYAVTVYQSIGSMHLKGKLAFFHQLPCQYKWNFSPFPQENRLFKASILSLVRSLQKQPSFAFTSPPNSHIPTYNRFNDSSRNIRTLGTHFSFDSIDRVCF